MSGINLAIYNTFIDLLLIPTTQIKFKEYISMYNKTNRFVNILSIPIDNKRNQEIFITWMEPNYILCAYNECYMDNTNAFLIFFVDNKKASLISFGDGINNDMEDIPLIHKKNKLYKYVYTISSIKINNRSIIDEQLHHSLVWHYIYKSLEEPHSYLYNILSKSGINNINQFYNLHSSKNEFYTYSYFLKIWKNVLAGKRYFSIMNLLLKKFPKDIIKHILKFIIEYDYELNVFV